MLFCHLSNRSLCSAVSNNKLNKPMPKTTMSNCKRCPALLNDRSVYWLFRLKRLSKLSNKVATSQKITTAASTPMKINKLSFKSLVCINISAKMPAKIVINKNFHKLPLAAACFWKICTGAVFTSCNSCGAEKLSTIIQAVSKPVIAGMILVVGKSCCSMSLKKYATILCIR